MIRIRSKTVEPVLGTLMNFLNMRRVNTRGDRASEQACVNGIAHLQFKEISEVHPQKNHSPSSSPEQRHSKGHRKANFWLIRRAYKPSKFTEAIFSKNERFFKTYGLKLGNGLF